jgi:hypothetical protein
MLRPVAIAPTLLQFLTTYEAVAMNFDRAMVTYPDGRLASLTPDQFYAIPLAERIQLLTSRCLKFEKNNLPIAPFDALRKK